MRTFEKQLNGAINQLRAKHKSILSIKLEGCDVESIKLLMNAQNVSYLPRIYRDFLSILGKSSGGWFMGSNITAHSLKYSKDAFREDLELLNKWDEKYNDVFVFMDHQGYLKYFFHTEDKNPDPIIFVSDDTVISSCNCRLSEFLLKKKEC